MRSVRMLLLVLLAAVAVASPASADAGHTIRTLVRPVTAGGLAPGYVVVDTDGGATCLAGSEVMTDGYRCFAGDVVADPCWRDPRDASRHTVVCLGDFHGHALHRLHTRDRLEQTDAANLSGDPWGLTLVDGLHCQLLQGTHDNVDGRPVDYYCDGNKTAILRGLDMHTSGRWVAASVAVLGRPPYYRLGARVQIAAVSYPTSDLNLGAADLPFTGPGLAVRTAGLAGGLALACGVALARTGRRRSRAEQ